MSSLKGKHVVLGITGGIAAYKSASLVRLLIKAGAEVQVIMTPAAREFITPLTMATLSRNPVITEFFTANTGEWHSHVDLGIWADCMIIAPATACTIGKMAHGIADNMLVTSYLSARSQVFVAPAMDFDMMRHHTTIENIATLRHHGNIIIEPDEGELASGLTGKGRMAEPEAIFSAIEKWFEHSECLKGKKILITAGPTYENLDPVRFIGNYSSGKMGYAIAEAAAALGAQVVLVSGPVDRQLQHPAVEIIKITSAREMLEACERHFSDVDIAIMSAAVSDYRPQQCEETKIKRENKESMTINLVRNPDIAATLGKRKKEGQLLVGFALETNNERENALDKMHRKNLDMIVMNSLRDPGAGFGTDTNKIILFSRNGDAKEFPLMQKTRLAFLLLEEIAKLPC